MLIILVPRPCFQLAELKFFQWAICTALCSLHRAYREGIARSILPNWQALICSFNFAIFLWSTRMWSLMLSFVRPCTKYRGIGKRTKKYNTVYHCFSQVRWSIKNLMVCLKINILYLSCMNKRTWTIIFAMTAMCVLVGHLIFVWKGEDKVCYPSQSLEIISSSSVLLFQLLIVL